MAVTPESPPDGAKWRLCLISEKELCLKLAHEPPLSIFLAKEFQDYYIPNDRSIICRYENQACRC